MKKITYTFLPLATLIIVALLLSFFSIPLIDYLLIMSAVLGLTPLIFEIFSSIKAKRINLEFPIVISVFILIFLKQAKLAAIFVLLILFGHAFKEYIRWRVQDSIESISRYLPDTAFLKKDKTIIETKISDIKVGDTVVIKSGGRVPVDGILLVEEASFDESVVSGESKPVTKKEKERVTAGAINLSDYVEMKAADTSETSTLAQIYKLVKESQLKKSPLSKFTDKYAKITSLVALALVIIVFSFSHNIFQALALWIALVPIIFAILVPIATTIGISIFAKSGVLMKNAEVLENITKIDTIVFDKTGTLTKGSPEITEIMPLPPFDKNRVLFFAASVEQYSEHPFSYPIIYKAREENLALFPMKNVHIFKGKGISAHYNKTEILVGNKELLDRKGIIIPANIREGTELKEKFGNSAIFVTYGKNLAGIIFVVDKLRESAKSAIKQLQKSGFRLVILTGDNKEMASNIAKALEIKETHSEFSPQDKIDFIKRARDEGNKVMMVGDGINDAPALAEANVGVAMALRGIDITLEAAEVILINEDLNLLPEIINSNRKILKVIKESLVLATSIHVLASILVILNIISIFGSVIFHQISSVSVLLNTSRIFFIAKREME